MMPGGDGLQNIGLQSLSGPSSDNIAAAVGVEAATLTGSIGLPTVPMDETTTSVQPIMVQLGPLSEADLATTLDLPTPSTTSNTRDIKFATTIMSSATTPTTAASTTTATTKTKKSTLAIFFGKSIPSSTSTTTTVTTSTSRRTKRTTTTRRITTSTTTSTTTTTTPPPGDLISGLGSLLFDNPLAQEGGKVVKGFFDLL